MSSQLGFDVSGPESITWVAEVLTWEVPRHGGALRDWASDQEGLSLRSDMLPVGSAGAGATPSDLATKQEANLAGTFSLILRSRFWASSTCHMDTRLYQGKGQQNPTAYHLLNKESVPHTHTHTHTHSLITGE